MGQFTRFCLMLSFLSMPASAAWALTENGIPGRYFDRVILVIFENTNFDKAAAQPFFAKLAKQGVQFTRFTAITHPSQPNYIALVAGSTLGVRDNKSIDLNANHIVDLLENRGVSWRVYAEQFPGNCFLGKSSGGYFRKHNPLVSFVNVQKNPSRCSKIVSGDDFERDATNGALPQYVLYVPDIRNDGHDTGVAAAANWYEKNFARFFQDPRFMEGTLIISTFDENAGAPGNQILTLFNGPMIQPQEVQAPLNLYSLLALVEDNWQLGDLGRNDRTANRVPNIWK